MPALENASSNQDNGETIDGVLHLTRDAGVVRLFTVMTNCIVQLNIG
jgi:hypothetical protein